MSLSPEEVFYIHKGYADQFAGLTSSGLSSAFSDLAYGGLYGYEPAKINITFPEVGEPKEKKEMEEAPDREDDPNRLSGLAGEGDFTPVPSLEFSARKGGITAQTPRVYDPVTGADITGVTAGSSVGGNSYTKTSISIGGPPRNWLSDAPRFTAPADKPSNVPPTDANINTPNYSLSIEGGGNNSAVSGGGSTPITMRIKLPGEPTYLTYPALVLPYSTITTPKKPTISNPAFTGKRPDDLKFDTEKIKTDVRTDYQKDQQDHRTMLPAYARDVATAFMREFAPDYTRVMQKVNNAIVAYTGGTGIPSTIEGAIMARAYDRTAQEYQKVVDTTTENLSRRGFTLPPGALHSAVMQARAAMGDSVVRSSTEVATKNLELEQQNFQFMLKLAAALEEKMLEMGPRCAELALRMDELAINSAKELVNITLAAYNLQVLVYKAMWDGYQADAVVLKARIEANDALVRMFDSEIKAEMTKTQINQNVIDTFRARAEINASISAEYKAKLEVAMAPVELMRAHLGLYELQLRGYATKTAAYETRWKAYSDELAAAKFPLDVYEQQVRLFGLETENYKTEIDTYKTQIESARATNDALAEYNRGLIDKYRAELEFTQSKDKHALGIWNTKQDIALKDAQLEIEYWRTKANMIFTEYNANLNQTFEFAREQMNLFLAQLNAGITASQGLVQAANVAGNLAGSAMQGLSSFAGNIVTN